MTTVPLSLYLDIEEGQSPDLEAVARASIAFSQAVKETAYILDPSARVTTRLVSGTEGSLFINGLIEAVGITDASTRRLLIATIVATVPGWFFLKPVDMLAERFWDGPVNAVEAAVKDALSSVIDDHEDIDEEDTRRIAETAVAILRRENQNQFSAEFFAELDRDPVIRGVGITRVPGVKPDIVVPKSDFEMRYTTIRDAETPDKRKRPQLMRLRIISPRLVNDTLVWKFRGPDGEFGASMLDQEFREKFTSGDIRLDLSKPINISATVEFTEKREGGLWVTVSKSVVEVHDYENEPEQESLFPR